LEETSLPEGKEEDSFDGHELVKRVVRSESFFCGHIEEHE
jgi:hypothetical protein